MSSDLLEVDVVPGKGGDIVAVRWRPLDLNVLWESPWGLRRRGSVATGGDSLVSFIEHYPGGWQTIFPNGGAASEYRGVELGFHGEATMAPWEWERGDGSSVVLTTTLVRSPFSIRREIVVDGGQVTVLERIRNEGASVVEAMWSHHPAFGAPFLDGSCRIDTGARTFVADDGYDTPNGDLTPGEEAAWPLATGRDGDLVDLSVVPPSTGKVDRLGYLSDFDEPRYTITNPRLGLRVGVTWEPERFGHAWYWCESHGTPGFPWHGRAYVLAIEPASSIPGQGITTVLARGGPLVTFQPGEELDATVTMTLEQSAPVTA